MAQKTDNKKETSTGMKTYVIEREIPNAGKLTADELKSISKVSCSVLKEPGSEYMADWLRKKIPGIPVTHIPAKNSLSFL